MILINIIVQPGNMTTARSREGSSLLKLTTRGQSNLKQAYIQQNIIIFPQSKLCIYVCMSASSHHQFKVSEMLSLQCKSFKDQGNS